MKNTLMNNVTNEYELAKKSGVEVYSNYLGSYYEVWYNNKYLCLYEDMILSTTFESAINSAIIELLEGGGDC